MKPSDDGLRRSLLYSGLRNAFLGAALFLSVYLIVVILTTPSLPPFAAVTVAARVNDIIILGLTVGIAVQSFLVTYSRQTSCSPKTATASGSVSAVGSIVSSFLSFFTLVPVGCCGAWLYIISFLPGILGVGASGFIIRYSQPLSLSGFVMMGFSILYTYLSIRRAKRLGRVRQEAEARS